MSPKDHSKRKLTDRFLESIKPPIKGRDIYADALRRGLMLRVGVKRSSWVFEKRVKGGPKRKHTLGAWPDVRLSEARALAAEIEAEAIRGVDRVAAVEVERLEAERIAASQLSVEQVLRIYADLRLSGLSTGRAVERELRRTLKDFLSSPMASLTRSDLQARIDDYSRNGTITYARAFPIYSVS
ncbi:integrase arm-type DNA-binding domain-containing protein [Tropicimonas sp. IMCC6043]|uniref:integrase arm-type DNA-binding domain-containing protein n=1 Tax=Tropicimonas sp. IMCC6043 TaxID=2510645 RepID=UPI0013EB94C5|nr:integrase arm-type DNA-binding domain-containing protein [Tropicimonas sp. IMCC6043]